MAGPRALPASTDGSSALAACSGGMCGVTMQTCTTTSLLETVS